MKNAKKLVPMKEIGMQNLEAVSIVIGSQDCVDATVSETCGKMMDSLRTKHVVHANV